MGAGSARVGCGTLRADGASLRWTAGTAVLKLAVADSPFVLASGLADASEVGSTVAGLRSFVVTPFATPSFAIAIGSSAGCAAATVCVNAESTTGWAPNRCHANMAIASTSAAVPTFRVIRFESESTKEKIEP